MTEWTTRWYASLIVMGTGLLGAVAGALLGVQALTAAAPWAVAPMLWTTPLVRAQQALDRGDTTGALSFWIEAQAAALRSGQWEGMIEVGDAARQFPGGDPRARRAYLTALFRARQQRSLDGVLRAATAFGELGDREVLAEALRIAEREAGPDPRAHARVQSVADRWMRAASVHEGSNGGRSGSGGGTR